MATAVSATVIRSQPVMQHKTRVWQTLSRFYNSAKHISFNFCDRLNDNYLITFLANTFDTTHKQQQLISIQFYYCYRLRAKSLDYLTTFFPNLRVLDLGRCFSLTDDSIIPLLARLTSLRKLSIAYSLTISSRFARALIDGIDVPPELSGIMGLPLVGGGSQFQQQQLQVQGGDVDQQGTDAGAVVDNNNKNKNSNLVTSTPVVTANNGDSSRDDKQGDDLDPISKTDEEQQQQPTQPTQPLPKQQQQQQQQPLKMAFLPWLSSLDCEGSQQVIFSEEDLATLAVLRPGLKISTKARSTWERTTTND